MREEGKLIELKTGAILWQGMAQASSAEQQQQQQGGLAGMLITAIIKQVMANALQDGHRYSGGATERLLATGVPKNGLLYGLRSPNFGKD